ncbi:ABC transporter substrate-binding protein [Nakamurella sp. YIM 132087]|uniref:ABC transporter substrate-binding protein n=1 Tax=Nakamurella alba TaxID=2665158 RepID=A0A7K1FR87_9ACTN|nr:zinc ABC transporter substrate-binding protein [Nakamurella alba]MTD16655.1 ABC transporter substrate-binding protein [Nakamurella alba]
MHAPSRRSALTALTAATLLALTACGSSDSGGTTSAAGSGTGGATGTTIAVVASTNVWGDIAAQIGGDHVEVSSVISDPSADPHSYEASAQTQLQVSKAAIVIENGGGYDDFMTNLLAAAGSDAEVINAVEVSGRTAPAGGELNEHVWYDVPSVQKVSAALVTALSAADPSAAADFAANAKTLDEGLTGLLAQEASIKAEHEGVGAAVTEPVPVYLLEASGLVNRTPEEFSEAVEEGTDAPARVLQETLALFTDKTVAVLANNSQTSDSQTEEVAAAAQAAGIPVVPFTETLPEGQTYVSWMTANLDALSTALEGSS